MFDMSPKATERRNGEAELAAYHAAEKSEMRGTLNQLERRVLLTGRLAEIYGHEFDAYHARTGMCPNCDKPLWSQLILNDSPPLALLRCSCGCEKTLSNGEWVMLHWTVYHRVRVPDHKTPLWWWLVNDRGVGALMSGPRGV
jgi:hypothetical protein